MSVILSEPSEAYHANPAIGSGSIRDYLRSPRLFHDRRNGIKQDWTDALRFGITSHMRLLEPELFEKFCVIKPDGLNLTTKEGKAWKETHAGKSVVSFKDASHLQRMHDRMPREVREIFDACQKEVTVRTEMEGLAVQCRPDLWNIEGRSKYDLKTINSIESIESTIWKLGYHIQERWYSKVIETELGRKTVTSELIFVEKLPPYRWRIVALDPDYQMIADEQIGIAVRGICERMRSGVWDDTEDDLRSIVSPPDWATEYLGESQEEE